MESTMLSMRQFHILIVCATLSTAFFLLPSTLIANAHQHAWLVPLWTGAVGIACTLPWIFLSSRYPRLDVVQIAQRLLGEFLGKLVSLIIIFHMLLTCAWVLNNLDDFMTSTLLQNTNEWVFDAAFITIAAYGSIRGIAAISRTAEFFFPLMLIGFTLFFILAIKTWDWSSFNPVGAFDWEGIFPKSTFMIAFPYLDGFTLLMIFPYVKEKPGRNYIKAASLGALLLSLITFIVAGVLGISRASHVIFPLFVVAQELEVSPFVEHLEATISNLWLILVYIKLTLSFYCATVALEHTFAVRSRGLIAFPLAIMCIGFAQSMHDNIIADLEWIGRYLLQYFALDTILLPILLILVYLIKRWTAGRATAS